MQLIRPHQVLSPLRDNSVRRRQQLRAYRGIQHIRKHIRELSISAGIRIIFYQMPHQRLWNPCIHAVHGHMIAIIGGPAQCQLRHISRPDDQSSLLIGNIHQHLSPLSGLTILVGHIMAGDILSDIPKMNLHRFFDIYLPKQNPQSPGKTAGIVISSVCGAETRHGHCHDSLSVHTQHIKCADCHQKRERGIQSPGNTQHSRGQSGVFKAFF